MRTGFPTHTIRLSVTVIAAGLAASCGDQGLPTPPTTLPLPPTAAQSSPSAALQPDGLPGGATVHVPGDYATIQEAVNAAGAGGKVFVHAGTYSENVVIRHSGLQLYAAGKAVLDGTDLNGIGIHVLGTTSQPVRDVEVSGFEVKNFERGIIVQFGHSAVIHGNEVHHNVDKVSPHLLGDATGIELTPCFFCEVTENSTHNNGQAGIQLRVGASDNVVKGNRSYGNGTQLITGAQTPMEGRGILLTGPGTTRNVVEENTVYGNWGRGILLARPAGLPPITGNTVIRNHVEANQRAGIAAMLSAANNFFIQNDARGNNLSNLAPCFRCNLVDMDTPGNTWEKNKGTFNLRDDCQN